jgi:hypothetical protein
MLQAIITNTKSNYVIQKNKIQNIIKIRYCGIKMRIQIQNNKVKWNIVKYNQIAHNIFSFTCKYNYI